MKTILSDSTNSLPANRTILLVDDDKNLRRFMHSLLTHYGYDVVLARDGVEAVSKYVEFMESIALVLMDVTMPRKDGIAAHYEIKDLNPDAIILFMSAYSETSLEQIPSVNFINKPMSCAELLQKVRELTGPDCQDMEVGKNDGRDLKIRCEAL